MQQYLDTLQYISTNGKVRSDRTGTGTIGIFGTQQRYDLRKGFPAVTTKKLAWRAVVSELLWFIEGSGDERRLCEILHNSRDSSKSTIWTENATASYWAPKAAFPGDLGRVYGMQWRNWSPYVDNSTFVKRLRNVFKKAPAPVDQLKNLIDGIKNDPFGRRHILTAWQPAELAQMALPPCHIMAQFYVDANNELSCQMYQRSNDFFLGCPFNIASYALLTHIIAQVCGLKVGEFVHTTGDAHIYSNHVDQVKEQLSRVPFAMPTLWINPDKTDIDSFTMDDFQLDNYHSHASIKAPMAV